MDSVNRKIVFHIEGMSCSGCETRIENSLKKLEGVIDAEASFASGKVEVTFDPSAASIGNMIEAIEKMDYKVIDGPFNQERQEEADQADQFLPSGAEIMTGNYESGRQAESAQITESNKQNIVRIVGIGIIILALYLIINNTIGFNFIPEINQSMGYGVLFVVGLLTSLHCVAMCGGINLTVCMQYKTADDGSKSSRLKPTLLYNLGRVISYTVIGGIVGALGSAISFPGMAKGVVAVISGIFMVIMGLNMLNIFPWLRKLNPRLPKFLGRKVHGNADKKGPLIVGLLNGLMPCGPLQAMQLYALGTGSFAAGALSMFLFSMGTVPLMFGFGAFSSMISNKFTHKMMKVSGVLVMVLGVIMLNRGLNLSGFSLVPKTVASAQTGNSSIARIENGVQYVTTELESGRYTPIIVQKGIPVKWTIKVDKGDLNGCNNPVTIPQYNKQKKLEIGDNLIEFTPDKEGDIIYTCWMGMISSRIRVVSDLSGVTEKDVADAGNAGNTGNSWFNGIEAPPIPTDKIAVAEIRDGIQYANIDIMDDRYSPAVIVLQKSVETVWTINCIELNEHNSQMIFPDYQARLILEEGENQIKLTPEFDFSFFCTSGIMNGYVKVVEDIGNIDIDAIKEEVKNYQPAIDIGGSGVGDCCH